MINNMIGRRLLRGVAGTLRGPGSSSLQRPEVLQDCCVAHEAAVAAFGSVAAALRGSGSSRCSVQEGCKGQ